MLPNPSGARLTSVLSARRSHAAFHTSASRRAAGDRMTGTLPSYGPVGVARALDASSATGTNPTLFAKEFSLADRVALVSGGNRGIGLEMALALVEAGTRIVYCLDLPEKPGDEFTKVREYASHLKGTGGEARLEYVSADVTNQNAMWKIGKTIGDREGRMDVCVAAAGILRGDTPCLTYPAKQFEEVIAVNVNGVLYTAQAAGQQMDRFGNGGSIIMIASISGHGANQGHPWVSYNTSKSAVLQMARSMACELGPKRIRVNTISPGYINTSMTGQFLAKRPELVEVWSSHNPLGRIGRPDELRGIVAWLASDSSSFCTGSDILVSGGHHAW
ncbi:sorbose reductase sou1 [Polyporus arcularius HHB13444]|uniref:Sorbose reductase sou1 n=1 Tax=Polyporus arcularius HHB13444 TaxID=1314778 RepID=A0A5C3NVX5_9APHY|nr:sorbose reductase sou1 [Polyporus arcularius HHB13444]